MASRLHALGLEPRVNLSCSILVSFKSIIPLEIKIPQILSPSCHLPSTIKASKLNCEWLWHFSRTSAGTGQDSCLRKMCIYRIRCHNSLTGIVNYKNICLGYDKTYPWQQLGHTHVHTHCNSTCADGDSQHQCGTGYCSRTGLQPQDRLSLLPRDNGRACELRQNGLMVTSCSRKWGYVKLEYSNRLFASLGSFFHHTHRFDEKQISNA